MSHVKLPPWPTPSGELFGEWFAPIMGSPNCILRRTSRSTMDTVLSTVVMALVVPVGWGLLSAWLFDRWRAWRRQERDRRDARRDDRSPEVAR